MCVGATDADLSTAEEAFEELIVSQTSELTTEIKRAIAGQWPECRVPW